MKRQAAPLVALAALLALAWAGPAALAQTPPQAPSSPGLEATSDVGAHDPTLIEQGGAMHVFTTGRGLQHLRSDDGGRHWQRLAPVFEQAPAWWAEAVPAHRKLDVWAPKVFAHRGRFWLLYSISTFGKNRSAIEIGRAHV